MIRCIDGQTNTTRIYHGISRYPNGPHNTIAVAMVEGDPEVWIIDSPEGIDALTEYYRHEYGNGTIQIAYYERKP